MTVVITGASRGIGRAIADRLYSLGHNILGISLSSPLDLKYEKPEYQIEQADVTNINDLHKVSEFLKGKTVSGLINCAGAYESLPFSFFPYLNYKKIIDINLMGTINACSVFIKFMDKDIHTPIINISSIVAHVVNSSTIYTTSKHAVEGFTSSLAKELNKTKIRPNAICPGMIETDMTRASFNNQNLIQSYVESQPVGIPLSLDHVANVVELLFDPKSNCIGGQAIQIG